MRICLFDNHRRNVVPHRLQVNIREKIIDHDFNQLPTLEDIHPKGFIASFDLLEGGYQPRQQTGVLCNRCESSDEVAVPELPLPKILSIEAEANLGLLHDLIGRDTVAEDIVLPFRCSLTWSDFEH